MRVASPIVLELAVALAATLATPVAAGTGPQRAAYRLSGDDASLFVTYANAGFRVEVETNGVGETTAEVEVMESDAARSARFPLPPRTEEGEEQSPAIERLARRLTSRARTVAEAQRAILGWISTHVAYDENRALSQLPTDVLVVRRAHCVGFSELAVALLQAAGIPARSVSGVWIETRPEVRERQETVPEVAGIYHRWIEVHDPARGWMYADPIRHVDFVTARYLPFGTRPVQAPQSLKIVPLRSEGEITARAVATDARGRTIWARAKGPTSTRGRGGDGGSPAQESRSTRRDGRGLR